MFYKDWERIYKKIARDFDYNQEKEEKAADILNRILDKKQPFQLKKLRKIIYDKEVVIFGAGPSLEDSINFHKDKIKNLVKISADGATSALLKNDIFPEIFVTDLDGDVSDQLNANSNGSVAVIHAHGDNISEIKKYLPEFKGDIVGSTQIDPRSYENVYNFGGFTDGDRAVFLSSHFNAKKIFLIGFDFKGNVGKYSYPEKKDINLKLRKLKWCQYLIEMLINDEQNIYYL